MEFELAAVVLKNAGLRNVDTPDTRELYGFSRDQTATYCSGGCSRLSPSRKGELIAVGDRVVLCPHCGSSVLFFESVSMKKAEALRRRLKDRRPHAGYYN